jgi:hypothetical protein
MRAELRYAGPETTGQGLPAVFALEPAQNVVDVGREGVALLYPAACSFSAAKTFNFSAFTKSDFSFIFNFYFKILRS